MGNGKSLGLKGAQDYGAGMRAHAEAAMPEVCNMKRGGKPKAHHAKPAGIPPQILAAALQGGAPPPDAGGMPPPPPQGAMPPPGPMPPQGMGMKKGGKPRHFAMGGAVGGIRKGASTPQGAPTKPHIPSAKSKMVTPKFKGKPGIGGC